MKKTYNQRLFNSPVAKFLHESRFLWVKKMIIKNNGISKYRIIELGCLDARILRYLPIESVNYYYGIDAGWDGYTEKAINDFKESDKINFLISTNSSDISSEKKVDIFIAMQVFEYIPDKQYKAYFNKFSESGCKDIYITASNERGLFMIVKLFIKNILGKGVASYSFKEIGYLITGRMDKIERKSESMKGFDYKSLIRSISDVYEIKSIVGLPFSSFPLFFNFTIAIHATRKKIIEE